jgi:SagB-type dehydrogenase family enzyme
MTDRDTGAAGRHYVAHSESLPIPGEVDWADAPGVFKLYRGRPRIALGYAAATGARRAGPLPPEQLGQLLADSYGLTRKRWTAVNALRRVIGTRGASLKSTGRVPLDTSTLRPVASGGARFPGELYVVAGSHAGIPAGVYHYDAAHHALVTLRAGDWTSKVAACVGADDGQPPWTILLSILFWKNAFKYGELSYRLCSLDGGALLGQLLAVAEQYRSTTVHYQFLDRELDGIVELDPGRESIYAAIAIGDSAGDRAPAPEPARPSEDPPAPPPRTNGPSTTELGWSIDALPALARVHEGAQLHDVASFVREGALPPLAIETRSLRSIALPPRALDLLAGRRRRRSSMGYFERGELTLQQIGELLGAAASGYVNDIDGDTRWLHNTALWCVINDAAGLDSGVYRYRPDGHALEQVRADDVRAELQASLLSAMFNLFHAGMCVYPVGDYQRGFDVHGDRWYRIQNLEAGIALQRLYLAAAALGLRCHANLGYSGELTHKMLGLGDRPLSALIQVMIGAGRDPGDYYEIDCLP